MMPKPQERPARPARPLELAKAVAVFIIICGIAIYFVGGYMR